MAAASDHSADGVARRGVMFVLSSPSGAGKSTLARKLIAATSGLRMSVSVTTRPIRPGEVEGQDYFFIDKSRFDAMVAANDLLEHAPVFDHFYGTPRKTVEAALSSGQDVLFDIDWQGTQQLYQRMEVDVVRVFLLPPSIEELEGRLRSRATDTEEVIQGRMARARAEISHWDGYDYVVINDEIGNCYEQVLGILQSERLRRTRQTGLIDFVRTLTREG